MNYIPYSSHWYQTREIMIRALVLIALMATTIAVNAGSIDEYKSSYTTSDAGTLPYQILLGSNCPMSEEETRNLIEAVIVRNRVKPTSDMYYLPDYQFDHLSRLYLSVVVTCVELGSDHYAISYSANFGRAILRSADIFPFSYVTQGPALMVGGKDYMRSNLNDEVESAMAQYLKANY
jgi:hypothetical protein